MTTTLAWVAAILTFPIILLLWITESKQQRARRLRQMGWTQQRIADHLKTSRTSVRRMLA
jgi:hypothetical protein